MPNIFKIRNQTNDAWLDAMISKISVRDSGVWKEIKEGDFYYNGSVWQPILRENSLSLGIRTSGSNMNMVYSYNHTVKTNPVIVIMGSSTAAGYGLGPTETIQYKVQQYVDINWGGATIINIATSGINSTALLPIADGGNPVNSIDTALTYLPDLILCFCPSNDPSTGNTNEEWVANIKTVRTKARRNGSLFYFSSPAARDSYDFATQTVLLDAALMFLADLDLQYNQFDLYNTPLWLKDDPTNPAKTNPIYNQGDKTHFNDAGTTYVVDNIVVPRLERDLRPNTAYKEFIIERSEDNVAAFTLFDTITDQQIVSKNYTKQPGYYRVTAKLKDDSYLPVSNVVQVTNNMPSANAGSDQLLPAGTTSTMVTGSGSDTDGSIVSYLWEVISGSVTLVNETMATVTVNGLDDGETCTLRLTVTDNAGATGTDEVTIAVETTDDFVPYRILIDVGGNGINTITGSGNVSGSLTPSPDGSGKYWNQYYGPENGDGFRSGFSKGDMVDTNNVNRGITFTIVTDLYGTFLNPSYNTQGINMYLPGNTGGGATVAVGDYPVEATCDSAFANTSRGDNGLIRFEGLDPLNTYRFKFWGARNNDGGASTPTRILDIKLPAETWAEASSYDAKNNLDYNNAAYKTVRGVSSVDFNVRASSLGGNGFGYIGVVDVEVTRQQHAGFNLSKTASPLVGFVNMIGGGLLNTNYNAVWEDETSGLKVRNLAIDATTAAAKWGENYASTNNAGNNIGEAVDGFRDGWWSDNVIWVDEDQNQLRVEGCIPNAFYTLTVYASRAAGQIEDGSPTVVVINNITPTTANEIAANGNSTPKVFTGIQADSSGYITLAFCRKLGESQFGFCNAFELDQEA